MDERRKKGNLYTEKLIAQGNSAKKQKNRYYIAQNRERTLNARKLYGKVPPCKRPTGNEFFIKP